MIIVLKGADFSANNLGKIKVSTDLSDEVKVMLSYYKTPLSTLQQLKVDSFIDTLKNNGIWDRISCLYMPILATDLTDAMFNLKKTYGNSGQVIDTALSDAYAVENKKGLYVQTAKTITNTGFTVSNVSDMDFHAVFYISDNISTSEISWADAIIQSNENFKVKISRTESVTQFGLGTAYANISVPNETIAEDDFFGANVKGISSGQNDSIAIINGKLKKNKALFTSETAYINQCFDVFSYGGTGNHIARKSGQKLGIISVGLSLTEEQMMIFNNEIESLVKALEV